MLINITGGSEMTLFEVNEASSLVHEAAHEDANIIVGAVIDDQLGEDELRVTVIATGLESEEARRTPPQPPEPRRRVPDPVEEVERERAMVDAPNVTPLREPEPVHVQASAEPEQQQLAAAGGQSTEEMAQAGFESPFEDELDTPAFLRKRTTGGDDSDAPPFMRRGNN